MTRLHARLVCRVVLMRGGCRPIAGGEPEGLGSAADPRVHDGRRSGPVHQQPGDRGFHRLQGNPHVVLHRVRPLGRAHEGEGEVHRHTLRGRHRGHRRLIGRVSRPHSAGTPGVDRDDQNPLRAPLHDHARDHYPLCRVGHRGEETDARAAARRSLAVRAAAGGAVAVHRRGECRCSKTLESPSAE